MDDVTLKEISGWLIAVVTFLGAIWKNRMHLKEKYQFDVLLKEHEAMHARKMQSLENALQIERNLVQLGHAKLIEKRASIIDDVYKSLVELHEASCDTIRPDYFGRHKPSNKEAYDLALPKFDSFIDIFERNKIYFPSDVAIKISTFYVAAAKTLDQARVVINSGESYSQGNTPNLQKLFEQVNYTMGEARKTVEEEFRNILRVQDI
ncbi:hypothetical protein AB1287_04415 [Enterobacter asburiae]|uniref:hypothetical protein n=1 Tax=Scandinavium sp. UTDF21-P1B TaxID=3446379 RepID=UPI003484D403